MTTKHTPGPWRTTALAVGWDGVTSDQDGDICRLIYNNGANAVLIAAAPDLLAALREIEAHHVAQNALKGRPQSRSHTLSICRAAIAKAEGREP